MPFYFFFALKICVNASVLFWASKIYTNVRSFILGFQNVYNCHGIRDLFTTLLNCKGMAEYWEQLIEWGRGGK
jgi:hypothetical protein